MRLSNFIKGLQILQKYYDQDGFHLAAEHDEFYCYGTDRPLSREDIQTMKELGWHQDEEGEYDRSNSWKVFL